jgi:hypothetical protein
MEIRIRESGQVMFESEFRAYAHENGGHAWDQTTTEILDQLGADVVFEGPQATGGTVYQYSMRQGVELIGDNWHTKYVLGPIFTGETAAADEAAYKAIKDAERAVIIRQERSTKLKECDWTQLADSPVNKETWATYRQSLRDVPLQEGFPWTITWPTQPEL